jgi:plastocyanin domain-containing protein
MVDGIQVVEISVGPRSYGEIVVQAGIPVRFNLKVDPGMLNGCNNAIIIPAFGIQKPLGVGDNIVEFTPASAGVIPYACWMGMIRSRITVVEASVVKALEVEALAADAGPGTSLAGEPGSALGSFFEAAGHTAGCCPP